jgi:SAM-dependent methyltransferase
MTSWTDGYVADIGYTHGFYRELTPALLRFVGIAKGKRTSDLNKPSTYCELGCGQGFSANLLAAANPHIEFCATDFNPSHIVGARALASQAGSPNVRFFDQSFGDFVNEPSLPDFDVISLHGIYSWIAAEHRSNIVRFIRRKLKPGGIVYISYNALPGWSAAAPLRHLMFEHGRSQGGSTGSRLRLALQFMDRVLASNARYFQANAAAKDGFERLKSQNHHYLAHEYLNEAWALLYHSDVAREMGEAKLTYLGSAALLGELDAINLTADQQKVVAEVIDPTFRETVRDFMVNQQFRRDVFVKGSVPLSGSEALAEWQELRVALSTSRTEVPLKVKGSLGEATLRQEAYEPVLDALARGPRTVRQLLADQHVSALGFASLSECLAVLIGAGHLQPCLNQNGDEDRSACTRAFNNAVLHRAVLSDDLAALASPVTGGGVPVDRISQLFILAHRQKQADAAQYVWSVLEGQGQRLIRDGKTLETREDNVSELRDKFAIFSKRADVLNQLGIT